VRCVGQALVPAVCLAAFDTRPISGYGVSRRAAASISLPLQATIVTVYRPRLPRRLSIFT